MKLQPFRLHNSLPILAVILAIPAVPVAAQNKAESTALAQAPAVPARIKQAIDETRLVQLKGNVHPLALPEFDRGPVPDSTPMNRMLLFLQRSPQQEAALQQLMSDQMSKASPNFHNWLTPAQFGAQFGPADADIQTVTNWLSSQGFHDIKVGTGRLTIEFSGDVGLVRHAFHTDIHRFLVNGEVRQANVSDPQIPSALTPVVAGIVSLHNFPKKSMLHRAGVFTGTRDRNGIPQLTGPVNCGTAGNPACFYALGPADFAAIYGIPSTLTGAGSKVAIIGFSDINIQDVRDFRTLFGLLANDPAIVHNGPAPGIGGEEVEADLDVEWSGAVAPQAEIDFVVSEDTLTSGGLELSALYVVDNNSDDIMNLSFGACEAALGSENSFLNALWEQAAAQGITVTVSAGDPGSAGCDNFNTATVASKGLAINGLASTPFNVAVGGTDFDDVGMQTTFWNSTNAPGTRQSVKGYIPETTWNNSCAAMATSANLNTVCAATSNIVGGSGGPSTCGIVNGSTGACVSGYAKPAWQRGAGVPSANVRSIPDVSLFASNGPQSQSFYVVCEADAPGVTNSCSSTGSFGFLGLGGTSASAPAFAGIMALIEQAERTRVPGSSGRQGNANFALYNIFQTAGHSCSSSNRTTPGAPPPSGCVFNDVTKGNNSVPCAGASTNCSSNTSGITGVLVEPSQATTPAWTTTAGYDLATGLGSVNVANLQNAWATAVGAFTPTSTSATVNGSTTPGPLTHGTSVALAVTVTSSSGTPTGDVSFLVPTAVTNGIPATPNGGVGDATLSGGSANLSTTFLPGGTYNLTAHYAGDGTFAPSDSAGVPVVVNKENSALQMGIVTFDINTGKITNTNASTFAYGSSPYILRMDVLNSKGTSCQPLVTGGVTTGCAVDATGTITLNDNGSPLDGGTFNVNSEGHAEDHSIQLAAGSHPLTAVYNGDNSYNASAQIADNVTVAQAATNITLTGPTTATANNQFNLTADVKTQSIGVAPGCSAIAFKDGNTVLNLGGDCLPTSGSAKGPAETVFIAGVVATTAGTHSYTATYTGETNYLSSASSPVLVTVKLGSSLSVKANPQQIIVGQSVTLTGLVDTSSVPPVPGPTGTVTFTGATTGLIANTVNCTATTDPAGNEACQATVTYSPASSEAVTATYSGDTNYSANNFSPPIVVIVTPPSFIISGSNVTATAGSSGTSTITVTPSGFTGPVNITCPATGLPAGVTCSPNPLVITVPSNGNGTGVLTLNVAAPSSGLSASTESAQRRLYAAGLIPSSRGWWILSTVTGLAAIVLLLMSGRKRWPAGLGLVCVVSFAIGCGGSYGGGGGGGLATTTTSVSVTSTKVALNTNIAFSISVTSTGSGANGQALLFDGMSPLGSAVSVVNGSATINNAGLTPGTHTISAHYLGDTYTMASQSGALSVSVTGQTTFVIQASPAASNGTAMLNITIN